MARPPPITRLLALTRRRWAIPILGDLYRLEGAKFITLCHRLEVHQGAMRQSLDHLIELGFVERNAGHGHPLRPEYLLTRSGARLAPACARVDDVLTDLGVREVCLRRWPLPILRVLREERVARFTQFSTHLGSITDRALARGLKELASARLLERTVVDASPPASFYEIARRGQRLADSLIAI